MIASKVNLTIVGVFVLIALGTLITALAILAGRTGPKDDYFTVFGNVAGLKYGSQVLYAGYPIGQVETIEPLRDKDRLLFRVKMSVQAQWPIPDDSVARSEASGLLAPQTVSISAGQSRKVLEPGSTIPAGSAEGLFSSLNSVAGNVSQITDQALMPLLLNLNRKVDVLGDVVEHDLRPLLVDAHHATTAVAGRMPTILANVDRAAVSLANASESMGGFASAERLARIDRMLADAEASMASLRKSSEGLQQMVQASGPELTASVREFRETTQALSRNAEPIAQNLNLTARNLQDFSRQLRNNPALLIRSSGQPDDVVPPFKADAK